MYISNFHSKKSGTQISISSYLYHKNRYIHLHDNSVVGNGKTSICYIHNNVVNINKKISLTNVPPEHKLYIFQTPFLSWGGPFIEVCWYLWPVYFASFLPVRKLSFQRIFVQPLPTCSFFPHSFTENKQSRFG